ncbi:hypothetical protein SLA2020_247420 [Shorea laevis]
MLLRSFKDNLPLIIIRPTIITSTFKKPFPHFPGYIESLRTIDTLIASAKEGRVKCFLGKPETIIDVMPADMVVNSTLMAMWAHAHQSWLDSESTSLLDIYVLPLKGLGLVNAVFRQNSHAAYENLHQKIKLVTRLVELYEPYALLKGIFDDTNSESLRMAAREDGGEFDSDPKCINWEDYILNIHIPCLRKYVMK